MIQNVLNLVRASTGHNKLLWVRDGYLSGCLNGEQDPGGEDALADYFTVDRFNDDARFVATNECRAFLEAAEEKCPDILRSFITRSQLGARSAYRDLGSALWCSANRDDGNAFSAYDKVKYMPLHRLAQSMFKPKRVRIADEKLTRLNLGLEPKPEADWSRFTSVTGAAEPEPHYDSVSKQWVDSAWEEIQDGVQSHRLLDLDGLEFTRRIEPGNQWFYVYNGEDVVISVSIGRIGRDLFHNKLRALIVCVCHATKHGYARASRRVEVDIPVSRPGAGRAFVAATREMDEVVRDCRAEVQEKLHRR